MPYMHYLIQSSQHPYKVDPTYYLHITEEGIKAPNDQMTYLRSHDKYVAESEFKSRTAVAKPTQGVVPSANLEERKRK